MVQKKAHADVRDRELSRKKLIAAVGKLLAKKGFQAMGVNAVAREAGLDKVLIYRYFGGLPGLISAFASEYDFWPSVTELTGGDKQSFLALPVEERLATGARNYMRSLRSRPLTREILSWMFLEQTETTKDLDAVRQRIGQELLDLTGIGKLDPGVDGVALMAIIGAATNHLCARSGKIRFFSGMDLTDDKDWQRLEDMLVRIIRSVVSAGENPGG